MVTHCRGWSVFDTFLTPTRRGCAGRKKEDMLDGVWEDGFFTVFPINEYENELPQDFATEKEAVEYGKENFGEGNYIVETPF